MTCSNLQIVHSYEQLGMTPSEIAEALEYSESAVKMVLASSSALYRRNASSAVNNNDTFTDEDKNSARITMLDLMKEAESEAVRYRCSKYVLDDKAGRLDVHKLANTNVSITIINERMKLAREALDRAKNKVVDVPPQDFTLIDARSSNPLDSKEEVSETVY